MPRAVIAIAVTVLILLAVVVVVARWRGPALLAGLLPMPSAEELYPPAPTMPPAAPTPIEDLLATYEAFLQAKAPAIAAALQPGLSDAAIDQLEATHSIKLTNDLRALYRWRNGTPRGANLNAFPDHEFAPLEVALANRDELQRQVKAGTPEQQQTYAAFAGHRTAWLGLIVDPAGDGCFFDPAKSESEGSFFYCFNEDASYVFYPAFRNYLAAVVEGGQSGVFVAGPRGVETADFVAAETLWRRFGAAPQH